MGTQQSFTEVTRNTVETHEIISTHAQQTIRTVDQIEPTAPAPGTFALALTYVRNLCSELEEHFRAEDAEHLLERLGAIMPEAKETLEHLQQEHVTILAGLQNVHDRIRRCTPLQVETLQEEVAGLLDILRNHEVVENELMEQALDIEKSRR